LIYIDSEIPSLPARPNGLPGGQAGEILKEMLKPKVLSLVQDLFSMTESEELSPHC
jgi:hypothetical protein